MNCPTFEDLLYWIEDGAAADAADEVSTHVRDDCPDCTRRLRLLDVLALAMGRLLPSPVPAALRKATLARLAAASTPATPAPPSGLLERAASALRRTREYVAELLLSGPAPAVASGLRGEVEAPHRVFAAGPFQVDVALVGRGSVMGQVSGAASSMLELEGATCTLFDSHDAYEVPLAADGGFRFEHLGPARYLLMIEGKDSRLLLPDVDLRDEADGPA